MDAALATFDLLALFVAAAADAFARLLTAATAALAADFSDRGEATLREALTRGFAVAAAVPAEAEVGKKIDEIALIGRPMGNA